MLQTLENLFTPIIAVYQISAAVKGCMGAGESQLKECMNVASWNTLLQEMPNFSVSNGQCLWRKIVLQEVQPDHKKTGFAFKKCQVDT